MFLLRGMLPAGSGVAGVAAVLAVLFLAPVALAQEGGKGHAEKGGLNSATISDLERLLGRERQGLVARELDWDRSLFVRDPRPLSQISFGDIMAAPVSGSDTTPEELFAQWWKTSGTGTLEEVRAFLACGVAPETGGPSETLTINGFAYTCPRAEATLAEPTAVAEIFGSGAGPNPFIVIAAVNRFDLMEAGTAPTHCGEFRLIAAKHPDWSGYRDPVFITFEAAIPNDPADGLEKCRAIQRFWAALSLIDDPDEIAGRLRRFYLEGGVLDHAGNLGPPGEATPGESFRLDPVMSAENMGADEARPRGQVRTNSAEGITSWAFREYEFRRRGQEVVLIPVSLGGSAEPELFSEGSNGTPQARALIAELRRQADKILSPRFTDFAFEPGLAQEAADVATVKGAQDDTYRGVWSSRGGPEIKEEIEALDARDGLSEDGLTKRTIINRLDVLTCVGCHNASAGETVNFVDVFGRKIEKWPTSINFTHVCEKLNPATGLFPISRTLVRVLLPHREFIMRSLLDGVPNPDELSNAAAAGFFGDANAEPCGDGG